MHARCTVCNRHILFEAKRAAKLKELRCSCRGKYEPMYFVRTDGDPIRGQGVYRNYNHTLYQLDPKADLFILIPPTVTP